jgi:ankyrin repeat protein
MDGSSIEAGNGYGDVIEIMIDCGAKVNALGQNQWSALHLAVYYGCMDVYLFC